MSKKVGSDQKDCSQLMIGDGKPDYVDKEMLSIKFRNLVRSE